MADTWEILLQNSTISIGDAWAHLNNQGNVIMLTDGLELSIDNNEFDIELDDSLLVEFDIIDYEIEIENNDYEIEVS